MYSMSLYQAGYECIIWLDIRQGINVQSGTILGRVSLYCMLLYQARNQCVVCHYIRKGVDCVAMYNLSLCQAGYEYVIQLYIMQGMNVWSVTILGRYQCIVCHYIRQGIMCHLLLYQAGYECIVWHYIRKGITVWSVWQ